MESVSDLWITASTTSLVAAGMFCWQPNNLSPVPRHR